MGVKGTFFYHLAIATGCLDLHSMYDLPLGMLILPNLLHVFFTSCKENDMRKGISKC